MERKQENAYELDYVYLPGNSEDFESVHVTMKVGDERISMSVISDKMIETSDLAGIIDGLKSTTFKRMNLKFGKDCDVVFMAGEQKFNVIFDEDTYALTGMQGE